MASIGPPDITALAKESSSRILVPGAAVAGGIVTFARIALIACVKSKQAQPAQVKEFYTSSLFKSAVRYAEANADKWYVLSAKHGLLSPRQVVAPYDQTLKTASRAEQRAWAAQVQKQLLKAVPTGAEILMLAGVHYRRDLMDFLQQRGHRVTIPLRGKRLGEQLQLLKDDLTIGSVQSSSSDLERFYAALQRLSSLPGQGTTLRECSGRMPWPDRGVYFFVERGELRASGRNSRVVRVGTHAVSIGARSTLWQRLRSHRGASGGTGNHRVSVFRRHVGAAILRHSPSELQVPTWGVGSNAPGSVRTREAALESKVTAHLGSTRVFWIDVPDAPSRDSARSFIERNAIALLSNKLSPLDPPSNKWLGRWSDREEIRKSGLWNVDYVRDSYDPGFLYDLDDCIERMATHTNK